MQCGTPSGLTTRSEIKPGWVASGLPDNPLWGADKPRIAQSRGPWSQFENTTFLASSGRLADLIELEACCLTGEKKHRWFRAYLVASLPAL